MNIKKKIIRKILILIIFVVVCIVFSLNTGKIKEYDYQNIMISYDDEGINRIKENDELTKNCVMSYDEYSSYCLRYNIAQKYNDESKYYAVYSFWFKGMCDYEIKSIKQIDKKIVINSKSSNFGPVADYTIIFIAIPVENDIKEIVLNVKSIPNNYN